MEEPALGVGHAITTSTGAGLHSIVGARRCWCVVRMNSRLAGLWHGLRFDWGSSTFKESGSMGLKPREGSPAWCWVGRVG